MSTLLKALLYNPLSLCRSGRVEEISTLAAGYGIILCPGTQLRAVDVDVCKSREYAHHTSQWGYGRGPYTNRSCGIHMFFKTRRFKVEHQVRVPPVPKGCQGRLGACRLRSGMCDLQVICGYYPPRPLAARLMPAYEKTVGAIDRWIRAVLSATPARCTPLLGVDLNDGLGLKQVEGQHIQCE